MVLEEVVSDPDPYFSPTSNDDGLPTPAPPTPQIQLSRLPQPVLFASLWGFTTEKLRRGIASEQTNAQNLLKRPLTTPEADALAFHFAKGFHYASLGPPIGLAAGFWRASATRNEMRWPLIPRRMSDASGWDLDKETHELRFRGTKLLQGEWIRPAIRVAKGMVYMSFGLAVSGLLFSSYGATVSAVGSLTDSRLKSIREAIGEKARRNNGDLKASRPAQRGGSPQGTVDPMGQGDRTAGELWKDHRRHVSVRPEDDASPTAGNDDFFDDQSRRPDAIESMKNELQMLEHERRQQRSSRRSPAEDRPPAIQTEGTDGQTQSFSDDFDMANSPNDNQSSNDSSGESTWDRIRRENSSSSSGPNRLLSRTRPRRQVATEQAEQERATGGDSFSFSSSDSERSYAKDEAQKHFDERVEQERRGEDFGSGRSRRW